MKRITGGMLLLALVGLFAYAVPAGATQVVEDSKTVSHAPGLQCRPNGHVLLIETVHNNSANHGAVISLTINSVPNVTIHADMDKLETKTLTYDLDAGQAPFTFHYTLVVTWDDGTVSRYYESIYFVGNCPKPVVTTTTVKAGTTPTVIAATPAAAAAVVSAAQFTG